LRCTPRTRTHAPLQPSLAPLVDHGLMFYMGKWRKLEWDKFS
jgi:hypothetical protein